MNMKTYNFAERHPQLDGPWANEPDKAQWIDRVTDLDCLVVRNWRGALCGYVGVQPGHKWHGVDSSDIPYEDADAHGGVNYSAFCMEGAEDGPGICHAPAPGRPANVWWLGFDCGHSFDLAPRDAELMKDLDLSMPLIPGWPQPRYRTFEYVQAECAKLAYQIHQAAS